MALTLVYNENNIYKTLDYWSRDMLNFLFFGKGSGNSVWLCMICHEKCLSFYTLLTYQISVYDVYDLIQVVCHIGQYVHYNCLVSQLVMSSILKWTLPFESNRFSLRPKSPDKKLNILRTKIDFKLK